MQGQGCYRKQAAAIVSLLQLPQRAVDLRRAKLRPIYHADAQDDDVAGCTCIERVKARLTGTRFWQQNEEGEVGRGGGWGEGEEVNSSSSNALTRRT